MQPKLFSLRNIEISIAQAQFPQKNIFLPIKHFKVKLL